VLVDQFTHLILIGGEKTMLAKAMSLVLLLLMGVVVPGLAERLAIVGGTLIDVGSYGHSTNDVADSVVLVEDGKITAVGPSSQIVVPSGVARIDAHGKFLIPGLIDGFGALRTQKFANAYLYEGVTTVYVNKILPDGGGDGEVKIVTNASPGPRLFLGAPMTGYSDSGADPSNKPMTDHRLQDQRLSNEQLIARIDHLADQGFRGITIGYDVWPDQVDVIVAAAKRRGLAILGELGFTSYPYAIRAGVDALLRNDSYLLELAPAVAKLARADNLGAGREANRAVCAMDPASSEVTNYGDQLAKSRTALMPTLVLEATADSLDVPNPWNAPSASLIEAADLDVPVDRATGASGYLASLPAERRETVRRCAWHKEALDTRLYQLGAKYLAGSIAPSYGVMPGSGLHMEITLLHRIGLSPREAIAAATSNYADIYGWKDVGRIEPGRLADVLILDADPRLDTTAVDSINTVVLRGTVFERKHLLQASDKK
jgi:Amidohydrolase family